MIRSMLKPFMKRFAGLFISMVFVSTLSIALLTAFASTIFNLQNTFKQYLADYQDVNVVADISLVERASIDALEVVVDGVEHVEYRLVFNMFMKKSDDRTLTARISTFRDEGDKASLFNRYILNSVEKTTDADKINVSIVRKFAENNDLKLGDAFRLGYFDTYITCYINEIVEVPEAIQSRINTYIWSDNTDFGFLYIGESEINRGLRILAETLEQKIENSAAFATYYQQAVEAVGQSFPDLVQQHVIDNNYTSRYTNQVLVQMKEGYSEEILAYKVKQFLNAKAAEPESTLKVKSVTENQKMVYYLYIQGAIRQIRVAAIFLPVFFFGVTMIVIALFINQIIKAMTPQIGVMVSIGVGKMDVISIFLVYSLLMSVCAGALGVLAGIGLNSLLTNVMIAAYSIPTIPYAVNPYVAVGAVVALAFFALVTTFLSCRAIFKITPKDATISNEAKRKKLSPKLDAFINKAPMNIKLGLNSIAQNPKRFFVSVFSIMASFVIILLSMSFFISKNTMAEQTVNKRLSFDAQVYMSAIATDEQRQTIISDASVKQAMEGYYTYCMVTHGNATTYLECLAFDPTDNDGFVVIPNKRGKGNIELSEMGVVLPKSTAKVLGVKEGAVIQINDVPVTVAAISDQYAHTMTYMSKMQMEDLMESGMQCVSTFLVNVNDESAFLQMMSSQSASLTVFTKQLRKDMIGMMGNIDIFIYILIGFSLGMAFVILVIMSQNALMEQKRPLSVLRLIGFTVPDISNVWTLQSISQLILSSMVAIPAGIGLSALLFKVASSSTQNYPVVVSPAAIFISLGFILLVIIGSHFISMLTIQKWNLADNTRSRE